MNKKNIKLIFLLGLSVTGGLYLNKQESKATTTRNLSRMLTGNTSSLVNKFNGLISSNNMASPLASLNSNSYNSHSKISKPIPTYANSVGKNALASNAIPSRNATSNAVKTQTSNILTKGAVAGTSNDNFITTRNKRSEHKAVRSKKTSKSKGNENIIKKVSNKEGQVIRERSGRKSILEYLGFKTSKKSKSENKPIVTSVNTNVDDNKDINIDPKIKATIYIYEKKGKSNGKKVVNRMNFKVNKEDLSGLENDIEFEKNINKRTNDITGELNLSNGYGSTKGILEGVLGSLNISVEDEKSGKVNSLNFKINNNKLDKLLLGKKDKIYLTQQEGNLKGRLKIKRDSKIKNDLELDVFWEE